MPKYLLWINAARGIATLSVLIFHYHLFYLGRYLDRSDIPSISSFPYSSLLWPIFTYGHWAVELFWIISGFVFSHVYRAKIVSAWEFFSFRFARLYPLHFACLLYMAILQILSLNLVNHWQIYGNNNLRHFFLQVIMMPNTLKFSRGLSYDGPILSVSIEVVAYFIFFIFLF